MVDALAIVIISALLGVQVWCGYTLRKILHQRSDERIKLSLRFNKRRDFSSISDRLSLNCYRL